MIEECDSSRDWRLLVPERAAHGTQHVHGKSGRCCPWWPGVYSVAFSSSFSSSSFFPLRLLSDGPRAPGTAHLSWPPFLTYWCIKDHHFLDDCSPLFCCLLISAFLKKMWCLFTPIFSVLLWCILCGLPSFLSPQRRGGRVARAPGGQLSRLLNPHTLRKLFIISAILSVQFANCYFVVLFCTWDICCMSVCPGRGILICSSSWGFFHLVFPVKWVLLFFLNMENNFLTWIEVLRTEDVILFTGCKAHWGNVTMIWGYSWSSWWVIEVSLHINIEDITNATDHLSFIAIFLNIFRVLFAICEPIVTWQYK